MSNNYKVIRNNVSKSDRNKTIIGEWEKELNRNLEKWKA